MAARGVDAHVTGERDSNRTVPARVTAPRLYRGTTAAHTCPATIGTDSSETEPVDGLMAVVTNRTLHGGGLHVLVKRAPRGAVGLVRRASDDERAIGVSGGVAHLWWRREAARVFERVVGEGQWPRNVVEESRSATFSAAEQQANDCTNAASDDEADSEKDTCDSFAVREEPVEEVGP